MSRTDRDITRRYPELAALATSLRGEAVVLDGELVSLDAEGRPSFGRLQHRMHAVDQTEIRRLVGRYPVTYMIFDLLHTGDQSLLGRPYAERRTHLNELDPTGPAWQTPPLWIGGGADILAATAEQGLEGIIATRLASTYQPGRRSPAWRKIKIIRTVDVRIGGWSPGGGRRTGTIGSLLVGVSTADGLAYVGNVGTGFTDATLHDLIGRLTALEVSTSPFDAVPVPPRVRPIGPRGSDPTSAARSPTPRPASKAASATRVGGACGSADRAGTRGSGRPPPETRDQL